MHVLNRGLVAVAVAALVAGLSLPSAASAADAMGKDHMHRDKIMKKGAMHKGMTHKDEMSK